jgi:hypothetical protein
MAYENQHKKYYYNGAGIGQRCLEICACFGFETLRARVIEATPKRHQWSI